ncbi:ABC-2 type transport system ATP-binding protein [Clostridium acetobutylicum]|uniref:ABC-type multidrug transport system, ATPase component n=1 Tax=Clostridium acetobutylicum (strain ATCC 824 / DSM 792 / JCM 1419 / IAM 19013 / LMG 5710 / NBRC 13948 / NRRL B-527 / VKM B-1787 / 2291 / W) TaxID=272562 RepID=Q97KQ6_CLOAB|nr:MULTISPECIES: ABC transporter ATP-binding protein [Clostridium]AAK78837.1 ABC-type multidrug transport system, ATPase component [Clostridium acetobutylicum ATCC 824]ADZ19912.1 ABC-type multidrug transport system, ATPase component [Clostridium acetobutylicum EA 2018]AEI34389.1 ABC-type multidrug transport system, ATPase component [Clostridium acetobutylicum DSM 1731]AWV80556.1 ABC transporter ATP-binding protein [Clostridium acetobutylicum]MBC2392746.1 ABC transporter ATP-binding protein [Cl
MKDAVLKTVNLSKRYKDVTVLDNVNITINKGDIYGFIGQNGAGKTTLMKLISGLIIKDSGTIELFGENDTRNIENMRKRMGCLIETPALYDYSSVYDNLEINRIQKGIPGRESIDKVLKMVGLYNERKKQVRKLSMGMKQKLGLAMALIGDPEFLILDEPINGLDPMSIIEIRKLLNKLNKEFDVTILISSHILSELYQFANSYGIIHNGRLVEQITSRELEERCQKFLYIRTDNAERAVFTIERILKTQNYEVMHDNAIKLYEYLDEPSKVASVLLNNGSLVDEIALKGDNLEDYFSKLVWRNKNV